MSGSLAAVTFQVPSISYAALAPILVVTGAGVLGVLVEAFVEPARRWSVQVGVAMLGLIGGLMAVAANAGRPASFR